MKKMQVNGNSNWSYCSAKSNIANRLSETKFLKENCF